MFSTGTVFIVQLYEVLSLTSNFIPAKILICYSVGLFDICFNWIPLIIYTRIN